MPELILNNISKLFPGGIQAIYNFNIAVEHGEFIVLVGPSGCGKTTILRMIAGLETITDGDMYLANKRINDVAPADRGITMVFQNYALYGHMSVYQNIGFSRTVRHQAADTIHEHVIKAADIVELRDQLNRYPKNLSGGQRQRVALGRSIASVADVILMDEPLSNLDAKLRVQARRELAKLHRQLGNTFIYVTHDQIEAMTMASRIVIMNGGRIQQIGTPAEVYHWPENIFVGGFIGNPPMNFIVGRIAQDRFIAPDVNLGIPEDLLRIVATSSNNSIILGVRAEYFSIAHQASAESISAEVVASEFLGDHSLAYLQMGDSVHIARLKENLTPYIGQTLEFSIDMMRVHFFDPESEKRLRHEGDK